MTTPRVALEIGCGHAVQQPPTPGQTGWVVEVTPPKARWPATNAAVLSADRRGRLALGVEVRRLESLVHLAKRARHRPRVTSR